jgi:hypothetical protein
MNITIQPINLTVEQRIRIEVGKEIPLVEYTIKPISVERPKLFNIIEIPWAEPQAVKIGIYKENETISNKSVRIGSTIKIGTMEINVTSISQNEVEIKVNK